MRVAIFIVAVMLAATAGAQARRATTVHNANWNDCPYGMNAFHPNGPPPAGHMAHFTEANIARLKEGRIRWVRLMVDWRYLEPQEGRYDWAALDRVADRLNRERIGISACLYEPPGWALAPGSDWRVRPEALERFGEAVARRFTNRIAAYEIDNEKATGTWPRVAERSAAVYVPMLKAAYRGIKRGDPRALVVMTGLWEFPTYYLEDMYRAGARGYFDAVNLHYYLRGDRNPAYHDAFRGDLDLVLKQIDYVTKKYGDTRIPLWITEYGWPATDESQAFPVGEKKQAEYMEYFLRHCMDSGIVEKAFWYVYYLSDGMALWHERENRQRPAFRTHTEFQSRYPVWTVRPVKPLPVPTAASKSAVVPNGSFESASGWTANEKAVVTFPATGSHRGERHLHVSCKSPGAEIAGEPFPLEGGRAYELTGFVRMHGGLEDPRYAHAMIYLQLLGEANRPLGLEGPRQGEPTDGRSTNYYLSDTGGRWYQVHYAVFAPAAVSAGRVVLRMGNPDAPRGEADFDDIRVRPLTLGRFDPPLRRAHGKALPRIQAAHARFVEAGTGRAFLPRGFNYIRLRDIGYLWHDTFSPAGYNESEGEQALTDISAHGFNTVRVFIDPQAGVGSVVSENAADLCPAYMANVADFLERARRHGIRVIFAMCDLPSSVRYREIAGAADSHVAGVNRYYLDPGTIRAKARYMADFVAALRRLGPTLLSTVLAYELDNESHFDAGSPPFSLRTGTFTFEGRAYALASEADLQRLADDGARALSAACVKAVHGEDPGALVSANVFTFAAVGRTGPGSLLADRTSDRRFPVRPLALANSGLAYLDVHLYGLEPAQVERDLKSVEWDALAAACRQTGKPILMGEFGAFRKNVSSPAAAAPLLAAHARRALERGFGGFLLWTYDSYEQEELWNALSGGGAIERALETVRPR